MVGSKAQQPVEGGAEVNRGSQEKWVCRKTTFVHMLANTHIEGQASVFADAALLPSYFFICRLAEKQKSKPCSKIRNIPIYRCFSPHTISKMESDHSYSFIYPLLFIFFFSSSQQTHTECPKAGSSRVGEHRWNPEPLLCVTFARQEWASSGV